MQVHIPAKAIVLTGRIINRGDPSIVNSFCAAARTRRSAGFSVFREKPLRERQAGSTQRQRFTSARTLVYGDPRGFAVIDLAERLVDGQHEALQRLVV